MDGWVQAAYWICLMVGVGYTLVSFVLGGLHDFTGHVGHVGGGGYSHDYGVGGHGHGTASGTDAMDNGPIIFGPFSPLVISFFLTCFGAVGILLSNIPHFPRFLVFPLALMSGFILAWLLIMVFNRFLGSLHTSSEVRLASLVGAEAEVTLAIPAVGVGEIAYVAMGSRAVAPARSEEQVAIPRFASVRVTRIVGTTFFVRPAVEEELNSLSDQNHPAGSAPYGA